MPRTVSPPALRALNAQYSSEAFVDLVTITSPQLEIPVRLANAAIDIVSRGQTFHRSKMDVVQPDNTGNRPPAATITLLNVDRTVTDAIRPLTEPLEVTIEIVRLTAPDLVEQSIGGLKVWGAQCSESTVQAALGIEDPRTKRAPAHAFVWSNYTGIR